MTFEETLLISELRAAESIRLAEIRDQYQTKAPHYVRDQANQG